MVPGLRARVMGFVHLHVHTEFSLLDGAARHQELLARAKALGMPALVVTDHGLYGVVRFYQKARELGIRPIIGCEVAVEAGDQGKQGIRSPLITDCLTP